MQELFKKYLYDQCSPEEVKLLLEKFGLDENKDVLKSIITKQLEAEEEVAINRRESILAQTYQDIRSQIFFEEKSQISPVVPITKRAWFRIAATAVIILAIAGTYLLVNQSPAKQSVANDQSLTDIPPGGNKALLTLADGSSINLETASTGKIAQQANAEISKLTDGQVAYNSLNEKPTEVLYNTVTTPRGGQYQLTLADGSKVWLNSASSIRFPTAFTGSERRVEMDGEVYFEVVKNVSMPFRINVEDKSEVEVLGTHFNINCYSDEKTINTSLLEGSIKITSLTSQKSQMIEPGQQAQLNTDGEISIDKKPDLNKVMAWKNGYFNLDGADTKTVMHYISRWYDIDVVFAGAVPQREFGGEIEKKLKLSQVLKILEKNDLHFKLEGRKLTVLQ